MMARIPYYLLFCPWLLAAKRSGLIGVEGRREIAPLDILVIKKLFGFRNHN